MGEVAGEARVGECGADVVAAGEHVNAVAGGHTDRAHRSVLAKAREHLGCGGVRGRREWVRELVLTARAGGGAREITHS
ncbi:hypothetical protein ACIOHE_07065 [Streptomyces sp. NPDC087851]|uniref:hypothetical protein n=1 Tax=Streptomyces sp. NPDC087851 TaxID=3365810 RepID=UPI00382FCB0B